MIVRAFATTFDGVRGLRRLRETMRCADRGGHAKSHSRDSRFTFSICHNSFGFTLIR
jgi:hypothetical protein